MGRFLGTKQFSNVSSNKATGEMLCKCYASCLHLLNVGKIDHASYVDFFDCIYFLSVAFIVLHSDAYQKNVSCSQFHQHFMYNFFVQMLFWQLFSSYMYVEKAAETTFV